MQGTSVAFLVIAMGDLTKVFIPGDLLPADIAHCHPTRTHDLVAPALLHETFPTSGTIPNLGRRYGFLDGQAALGFIFLLYLIAPQGYVWVFSALTT
mmetsp:Transcript_30818/g.71025  ORF Transcript_30818/g.71025 Transcript_30818/m.71025 type:complete len:97 (+) Transcript_30818:257-547(+)